MFPEKMNKSRKRTSNKAKQSNTNKRQGPVGNFDSVQEEVHKSSTAAESEHVVKDQRQGDHMSLSH